MRDPYQRAREWWNKASREDRIWMLEWIGWRTDSWTLRSSFDAFGNASRTDLGMSIEDRLVRGFDEAGNKYEWPEDREK